MAEYDFPDDLRDAQLRLHQARSAYRALCRDLPWSVEPAEGWTGEEGHYSSYRREFPESPGWGEEQRAEEARLRELVLTLSIEVSTHPYWAALAGPDVVKARMALKHAEHAGAEDVGAAPARADETVAAGGSGGGGSGRDGSGRVAGGGGSEHEAGGGGDGSGHETGGDGTAQDSAGDGSGGAPPMNSAAA
ncbi:hypothetical protein ACISU4_25440 [Streptomyces wuyuanensis]|uniref:hypothetical protein n=1 Tax=Streptomyces wuyuanensis TaxID=1196353 RepID=UPI003807857E